MKGLLDPLSNAAVAEGVMHAFLQSLCIGSVGYLAVRFCVRKHGPLQGVLLFAFLGGAVLSLVGGVGLQATGHRLATISLGRAAVTPDLPRNNPVAPLALGPPVSAEILRPPSGHPALTASGETAPVPAPTVSAAPLAWGVMALNIVGLVWVIGIGVSLFRFVAAAIYLRRLRRWLPPLTDSRVLRIWKRISTEGHGFSRRARLLMGPAGGSPFAFGTLTPTVVVPRDFESTSSEDDIEAALAHEWAHLRNGDLVLGVAQRLVVALHWWNPFLRRLSSALSLQREIACDSRAASYVGHVGSYARSLVNLAERTCRRDPMAGSVAMVGASHSLETRLKTLTNTTETMQTRPRKLHIIAIYTAVVALVGLTSGIRATFAQTSNPAGAETRGEDSGAEATSRAKDESGGSESFRERGERREAREARKASRVARDAVAEARKEAEALRREVAALRAQLERSRQEAQRFQQLADVQVEQAAALDAERRHALLAAKAEAQAQAQAARAQAEAARAEALQAFAEVEVEKNAAEAEIKAETDEVLSLLGNLFGEGDGDVEKEIEKKSREFAGLINDFVKQVVERATLEVGKQVEEIQRQMENEARDRLDDLLEESESSPREKDPTSAEEKGADAFSSGDF